MVELIVHLLHALLAHARQRFALRKVLAQEAVGVLVGAALPRMVRKREVELDVDVGRDLGMVRELLAAVERDGPERLAFEGPRHLVSDALGGLAAALPVDQEAVLAVDERQQAGAAALPATVSPSQWPGSLRPSAAAGRSDISWDTLILPRWICRTYLDNSMRN